MFVSTLSWVPKGNVICFLWVYFKKIWSTPLQQLFKIGLEYGAISVIRILEDMITMWLDFNIWCQRCREETRMEPWGTPASVEKDRESAGLILSLAVLLERHELTILTKFLLRPNRRSFQTIPTWKTLSKSMSKNRALVYWSSERCVRWRIWWRRVMLRGRFSLRFSCQFYLHRGGILPQQMWRLCRIYWLHVHGIDFDILR